uniref:ANK_REP_REGION domain-containing protein n=1 Tax=Bursaphelenchus xylophilus TaxID=6326 RepID=A0A1I7SH44_BURXY
MMLNVDTTHCKASETQCPKNLVEAAKALMSPTTQRALQPLGIHVKDAEGPQKPESAQKGLWFTVLVVAGLCSLLIISAVNVLTNLNKNKKDPFTGMIKKGSLIYHANSKRNSKSFSASTFIPPMEKPLIPTVQAYDYLQNPSYMQFGGFGHQNYGMIPSNSQSSRIEKPRIITADETKLLPERASAADDIHRWAIEPGTIKSLPEGAQINRPDHVCRTALHWVVEIKEEAESLIDVNFLYHKGADLNAFDMGGDTPLMLAVKTWRNELVMALLALGADPTLVNTQGDTALHLAVQTGNELAVSNLLKCPDIDIELGNEVEDTPLKLSAKVGGPFYGIASKLIDAGAQVDATGDGNKVNGLKRTALHEASLSGSEKIMELLLKNGAQVDAKDSNVSFFLQLGDFFEILGILRKN